MNKNYFIFAGLALALSACTTGTNVKPDVPMSNKVDAQHSINDQTGNITRNIGDRTSKINQIGKTLPWTIDCFKPLNNPQNFKSWGFCHIEFF